MITSVVWQKNPVAIAAPIEKRRKAKDCRFDRTNPAANLSFSFNKATPPGFAPKRQLPLPTIGALHCTGTVAGGIFRVGIQDI
ncbi:hypothetical protein J3P96_06835 [Pseudomonas sp. R3-56]|uniref:hypothetical protein n=1 Tax=unclassified Pseudomonas TaxID=196821 RepID=UPI003DA81207